MTLSAGKFIWLAFKWLIVPCSLGAVGYYVIGPKIGQVPVLEAGAEKVQSLVRNNDNPSEPTKLTEDQSGPQIDVSISVEKADRKPRRRSTTRSVSTTRRSTEEPKPPTPRRPEGEQADPASGGGAISPANEEPTSTGA